jgi:hypothetical protein
MKRLQKRFECCIACDFTLKKALCFFKMRGWQFVNCPDTEFFRPAKTEDRRILVCVNGFVVGGNSAGNGTIESHGRPIDLSR